MSEFRSHGNIGAQMSVTIAANVGCLEYMCKISRLRKRCQNSDVLARLAQISVTIAATEELLTAFPVAQKTGS